MAWREWRVWEPFDGLDRRVSRGMPRGGGVLWWRLGLLGYGVFIAILVGVTRGDWLGALAGLIGAAGMSWAAFRPRPGRRAARDRGDDGGTAVGLGDG